MLSPRIIYRLLCGSVVPAELNEEVRGAETAVQKMLWTVTVAVGVGIALLWKENVAWGQLLALGAGAPLVFAAVRGMVRSRQCHLAYEAKLKHERNAQVTD